MLAWAKRKIKFWALGACEPEMIFEARERIEKEYALSPIVIEVKDQTPRKDAEYWGTVASVLGNKPFIQELYEAQLRYEREMAAIALEDDFKPQKMREVRLQLFTIKNFAAQLAMAPSKAKESEERQMEE